MSKTFDFTVFLIVMAGWIFSLCLHEFSHALVAYHGGDRTVREKGYLTFNPLKYTDPVGSLLFPLIFLLIGGIGLPGGAVYVETWRLRSRLWNSAVSLAGPFANILLLGILVLPYHVGILDELARDRFSVAYAFLAKLQLMAIVFNLLPVPPLDGFGALAPYLKPSVRAWCYRQSMIFLLALFVLLWRVDFVNHLFWDFVNGVSATLGIPNDAAREGFQSMRIFGP